MIKIKSISIFEFRGIRELTLDFEGRNFAVCGPNGTGKSGVVDAIDFALTGDISRLSGKGMGEISLKDHAPHVDSRNRPDRAKVAVTLVVPTLKKEVLLERTVREPKKPRIVPSDPEIIQVLDHVAQHPEFALSRREIIKYVISTPGDRSIEIQELLKLDSIGTLRTILQRIGNSKEREQTTLERERNVARARLIEALCSGAEVWIAGG